MSLTTQHEEILSNFIAMTNAEVPVAKAFLKATGWDINTAMDRFFAFGGDVSKLAPPKTNPPPTAQQPNPLQQQPSFISATANLMQQAIGGFFGSGQVPQQQQQSNNSNNSNIPSQIPVASTQTDQDALLAQQLSQQQQQPLVRAPDSAYQDRLVGPYTNQYGSSLYKQRRDAQQNFAKDWQKGPRNQKSSFLGELFRDPEYKFGGSLEEAKKKGLRENKWVLINIQDTENFCSHCLNRDIWKDKELGPVIKESFIFYQWMNRTDNARRVINLYHPKEFPCIFVIDPSTGRHEYDFIVPRSPDKVPTIKPKLLEFLDDYPNPKAKPKKKMVAKTHIDTTHDDHMLQQAIAASLDANGNENENENGTENEDDTNGYNSNEEKEEEEKQKQQQQQQQQEEQNLEEQPDANDANATAIRIRIPNGGILQRYFKKDAKVAQLYIWCTLTLNGQKVSLIQTMPRLKLDDMKNKTLKELGLIRATLVCSYLD